MKKKSDTEKFKETRVTTDISKKYTYKKKARGPS